MRGHSLFIDPSDVDVSSAIRDARDYETATSDVVADELRGRAGTFVDIGSNIGWYLMLAHSVAPHMRLIGFEPNPRNVQLCYRTLWHHELVHAHVHALACSDREQFLTLRAVGSNGAVSAGSDHGMMVKAVPADLFLKDAEDIRMIKIDVEGHEPQVLIGLAKTIQRHKPVLVTEFHPYGLDGKANEYLDAIMGLGYDVAVIQRDPSEGREAACASVAEVESLWRRDNERADLSGHLHLDLICRPKAGSPASRN